MDLCKFVLLLLVFLAVPPMIEQKCIWAFSARCVSRAIMMFLVRACAKFAWIIYVFGGFPSSPGIKMILKRGQRFTPSVIQW